MKQKTVTIEIDEQGNSSIDLAGFQGKGCGEQVMQAAEDEPDAFGYLVEQMDRSGKVSET